MNDLTNRILAFLQNLPAEASEQFNQAFALYRELPNKSKQLEMQYNRLGYSERALKNLLYDLQKLAGISDTEILTVAEEKEVVKLPLLGNDENSNFLDEFKNGKSDLDLTKEKEGQSSDSEKTQTIALREEFPFLNDADCPEIMFVVVGKRISAYKEYQRLHGEIQDNTTNEIKFTPEEELEKTLACERAFNKNQLLWDELNFYNKNRTILGKHPLFREQVAKREVDAMTNEELFKFKNSSATFLSRKKRDVVKFAKDADKVAQINKDIADREYRLELVNAKIGVTNDGEKK
jgi:hypothetical protein